MPQCVRGKVMVITGASSGIGRAAARLFAAEEAKLALVARSEDKLMTLAKEIGGDPLIAPTDITRPGDVETPMRSIEQHFGWIDILCPMPAAMSLARPRKVTPMNGIA